MRLKRLLSVTAGLALMAAGLILLSWREEAAWMLLWPTLVVLYVGVIYVVRWPRGFGKDPVTGKRHVGARLLLAPWFLLQRFVWWLEGKLIKEPPLQEVAPGLMMGRLPDALPPEQAALIVDMTAEFDASRLHPHQRYVCLPTLDSTLPDAVALARLVEQLHCHPETIYVYCASGHGRSATLMVALMLRRGVAPDARHALAMLQAARPNVRLSDEQLDLATRAAQGAISSGTPCAT